MSDDPEKAERIAQRRLLAQASAIGIQFAVSIGLPALIGHWLDGKFHTRPCLLLTGVVLGSTAAFRDLYRVAKKIDLDRF